MSAVSETIVREYFELHGFFVRQQRKYIATTRREEDEIDFLIEHPRHVAAKERPFELTAADLGGIACAVVVVKGWHTDTFSPGLLANAPEIFRFLEAAVFQETARSFPEGAQPVRLLVVPALPHTAEAREQSIDMLRAKGVDAVIVFRTMLAELIAQIEVNRNYQKSDLLQVMRILKNYEFIRDPQLELFKPRRASAGRKRRRP